MRIFLIISLSFLLTCKEREIVGCQCQNNRTIFFNEQIKNSKVQIACQDSCNQYSSSLRNFIYGTKF
jgi:hypothetical protein